MRRFFQYKDKAIEKDQSAYNDVISEIKRNDNNYDEAENIEVVTNAKIGFSFKNGYINVSVKDVFDKNGNFIVNDKLKPSVLRILNSENNRKENKVKNKYLNSLFSYFGSNKNGTPNKQGGNLHYNKHLNKNKKTLKRKNKKKIMIYTLKKCVKINGK